MARSVTLTTLRLRVRRAGDWENATNRVTTSEVDDAINEGIADTWETIVKSTGHGGWKRSESAAAYTSAGTGSYALASDVLAVLSVKMTISGRESSLTSIDEVMAPEATSAYATTGTPLYYTLAGDYVSFSPTPDSDDYSYRYAYVPRASSLSAAGDTFDGINGWERRVVYLAVREIAFKQKEWELADRADVIVQKETARILEFGKRRDPQPATMIDQRGIEVRNKRWSWR